MTDNGAVIEPPDLLWARWAAFAATLTGHGYDDTWTVGGTGAHHDDGGGNWAHLALLDGGRAVLYGYDHEYSDTIGATPPIDLLAGAPDWVPWDDLTRYAAADELGYVYWHADGAWSRVDYPDGVGDGLASTAAAVLGADAAVDELLEFVTEWGGHDHADPAAARRLLAAAGARTVDAASFQGLHVTDLAAALAVAARGGLTPGSALPLTAPGRRPATRRLRTLSDDDHDRLVWDAMRRADELDRPAPIPSPALDDLVNWARGRAPARDGRCSVLFYADDSTAAQGGGEHPPAARPGEGGFGAFDEVADLVQRVRAEEADRACGRWLFLRVETTADGAHVERRYDSWPSWWDDGHFGPWRSNLRTEMDRRAEPWRPSWTSLLDPSVAYGES